MNALRRDLLERRLWPVVAVLVLCVGAFPMMLGGKSPGRAVVPPAPRAATGAPASAAAAAAPAAGAAAPAGGRTHGLHKPVGVLKTSVKRDPFTSSAAGQKAKAAAAPASPGVAPTTPVPPSPATVATNAGPSGSSSASPPSASHNAGGSAPAPTAGSTPTAAGSSASVPVRVTPAPAPRPYGTWTLYSVAVRMSVGKWSVLRTDVPRLTPFPIVAAPAAMFMGVLRGGRQVVFALAGGASPSGAGLCRPSRAQCAAIVLAPGQTERVTAWLPAGSVQVELRVARITHTITHSWAVAQAAYARHSDAGRCELALADPVLYAPTEGTLAGVARAACRNQRHVVPFPGRQGAL